MAAAAFWLSAALLAFTFAGYPLLIAVLSALRHRKRHPQAGGAPGITVLIVACNEAQRIVQRISNILDTDHPPQKLRVIVVSDGSVDDTVASIQAMNDPRVRVIIQPERLGKAAGLNAGIATAEDEIIVLADARQTFPRDTIPRLAAHFADPAVGAVSGELDIASAKSGTGAGVDAYWRLERFLRSRESQWDSCIGCTGACYAIRRALFTPLPEDTILDDVVIPMRIAAAGYRVLHDPAARAFDPQPLEPQSEKRRKRRTLAGNFQMLFRHPHWLLPWRNRLWWQLIAHKYLRLAGPFLLLVLLGASAQLAGHPFYRAALLLQAAFYLLAALGMALPLRHPLLSLPAGFVFLNLSVLAALWHWLTAPDISRWQTHRK